MQHHDILQSPWRAPRMQLAQMWEGEGEDVSFRLAEAAGRGKAREAMSSPPVPPVRDAAERAVMAR